MTLITIATALLLSSTPAALPQVRNISPKGELVSQVSASPRNPLLSLLRNSDGSVLRSGDGGATYLESSIALSGVAGTLDWDAAGYAYVVDSGQVHVSTDGAQSWTPRALPSGTVRAFAASKARPFELWVVDGLGTVYRSQDAGATWSLGLFTAPTLPQSLALDPQDPDKVGVYSQFRLDVTEDGGATWNDAAIPTVIKSYQLRARTIEFLGERTLHHGELDFGFGIEESYVHVSDDGGATWLRTLGLLSTIDSILGADPADPDTVYFSANNTPIYQSIDAGTTWSLFDAVPVGIRPRSFAFAGGDSNRLLVGCQYGIARTDDDGEPFGIAGGELNDLRVLSFVQDPKDPLHLVATVARQFETFDGGQSWSYLPSPVGDGIQALKSAANGSIYCARRSIWRRDGAQWTFIATPPVIPFTVDFHIGELNPDLIVALSGPFSDKLLSISADGGLSWSTQPVCLDLGGGSDCSLDIDGLEVFERAGFPARIALVAEGSTLAYTDDGGANYISLATNPSLNMLVARGRRELKEAVFGVTENLEFLTSVDALATASPVASAVLADALAIGSGIHGVILRSTVNPVDQTLLQVSNDGGVTWSNIDGLPESDELIRDLVVGVNDNEALVAGNFGLRAITLSPTVSEITCVPPTHNSTGVDAALNATGSRSISGSDVSLDIENLPRFAPCLFLGSLTEGFTSSPGGSMGDLCLSGAIGRFAPVGFSGASGAASIELDPLSLAQPTGAVSATAGQAWFFQAWYRDAVSGVATSNFSNAVELVWEP